MVKVLFVKSIVQFNCYNNRKHGGRITELFININSFDGTHFSVFNHLVKLIPTTENNVLDVLTVDTPMMQVDLKSDVIHKI